MSYHHNNLSDTIVALATPPGIGAIGVIRLSGTKAISICNQYFHAKDLSKQTSHTIHYGYIKDGDNIVDEVMVSVFKAPKSFTTENAIEIACHGSQYIQQQILQLLIRKGARLAQPGEFTMRAFLNGRIDLTQAEAVADLIASESAASHDLAIKQMRGGFSSEIEKLRQQLLNFASLIELELDFAEEDVEFADRTEFTNLINQISHVLKRLIDSFALGNVLKNGIPIAIVGEPNVGKSTLLNVLLNEEKAIVSHIAGTTRDAIEDEINIEGIAYRFIDTAGIRTTEDYVENIGITKTYSTIEKAQLVLQLIDASNIDTLQENITDLENKYPSKKILTIVNKADLLNEDQIIKLKNNYINLIVLSAKNKIGIEKLTNTLTHLVNKGALSNNETIVSNSRHFEALNNAYSSIKEVQKGIENNISTDLFAIDIRQALFHLGEITGEVTTEDLLGNIFANFCIGK